MFNITICQYLTYKILVLVFASHVHILFRLRAPKTHRGAVKMGNRSQLTGKARAWNLIEWQPGNPVTKQTVDKTDPYRGETRLPRSVRGWTRKGRLPDRKQRKPATEWSRELGRTPSRHTERIAGVDPDLRRRINGWPSPPEGGAAGSLGNGVVVHIPRLALSEI
jgi:hypothetical protein